MASSSSTLNKNARLADVVGLENRKNSVYIRESSVGRANQNTNTVVFFGGDGQDYKEIMNAHRENRRHSQWNLENTADVLARKFPAHHILIVKPTKMYLGIFCNYANFVPCNEYGVPEFRRNHFAWTHLKLLIENSFATFGLINSKENFWKISHPTIVLIGFSKGCVVLNQLVHELPTIYSDQSDASADDLVTSVTDFYWLDGGHSGGKNTWITDATLLKTLAESKQRNFRVHVHVTPYQISDKRRPHIGREERRFSELLSASMENRFQRHVHFQDEDPSIDNHFNVLNVFEKDKS